MRVPFHHMRFYLFLMGVVFLCVGAMGCGKKAMPVAPKQGKPTAVSDLSYRIEDGKVRLDWTVPDEVLAGKFGQGKLVVLRSKTGLSDICSDCPQVFQRVTRKRPLGKAVEAADMAYEEALEDGFRYTFKVVSEMDSGYISDDSNIVTFNAPRGER
jgi:hypothetical protein